MWIFIIELLLFLLGLFLVITGGFQLGKLQIGKSWNIRLGGALLALPGIIGTAAGFLAVNRPPSFLETLTGAGMVEAILTFVLAYLGFVAIRSAPKETWKHLLIQIFLMVITVTVMFPILWIFSLAIDPRNIDKPLELTLIPPGASFEAFRKVLFEPFGLLCKDPSDVSSCMTFGRLLINSLTVALGTSLFAVFLGASAAYAFSRFKFVGRQAGMLGFIVLLMLPSTATLAPLFVLLSQLKLFGEPLRTTLIGLMIAYASGTLPFAIWNLKGYFDTVPKELEEAALIDGASVTQTFFRIILPLSVPALAVTVLFAFMSGWTEFVLAWTLLEDPSRFTLAMALRSMQGQFSTPWSEFAAMSILMSIPIVALFFSMQRYIVSGLTVGGVKG